MAHLVETMAYAGATPWHGLGNQLTQKQPIEVWQREAGMDWAIQESPVLFKSETVGLMAWQLANEPRPGGTDAVIDAVGMEAHGFAIDNIADRIKQTVGIGQDRAHVLRQAIMACRKSGRVSVPGVYGGKADLFPLGAMMQTDIHALAIHARAPDEAA